MKKRITDTPSNCFGRLNDNGYRDKKDPNNNITINEGKNTCYEHENNED